MKKKNQAYIQNMPKVELHVHLEGAFTHDFLFDLIQKYGGDPDVDSVKALEKK
ncbi:adenosine deaminase, partial [candidate division KSB1 bacterium]|nr:adenosine deaminase [candidate division KSB1 bacterium]